MFWNSYKTTFIFQLDSRKIQDKDGETLRVEIIKELEKKHKIKFVDFFVDFNSMMTTFILSEFDPKDSFLIPLIYRTFAFSKNSDKNKSFQNFSIIKIKDVEVIKIKTKKNVEDRGNSKNPTGDSKN